MDQIKIGKFIAERRKKQGLLQKDIAARLGLVHSRFFIYKTTFLDYSKG